MDRAPERTIVAVSRLAHRVLDGDIVLPEYRRGFVWSVQQALHLLDPVHRNYPIGGLSLWQSTERLAGESKVANLDVQPPREGYPVDCIIDGRQRLAGIIGALHGGSGRWNTGYDLEADVFLELAEEQPPAHIVPMKSISSPDLLFSQVAALRADQETGTGTRRRSRPHARTAVRPGPSSDLDSLYGTQTFTPKSCAMPTRPDA